MARIRSIKPGFFTSEDVSVLPLRARLTWIGLWTHCDDQGRAKDNLRLIKAAVWPLDDVTLKDIEEDLVTLAAHRRIVRYEVDGARYLAVANWRAHQHPQKPTPSRLPAPPDGPAPAEQCASEPRGTNRTADSGTTTGGLREDYGRTIDGRVEEGRGKEGTRTDARNTPPPASPPPPPRTAPPPLKCVEHRDDPNPPPCRACADARKNRTEWERQKAAADSARQSERAHQQAEARRLAIAECRQCDADGYLNGTVCNHDPTTVKSAGRGAAMARDLLKQKAGTT